VKAISTTVDIACVSVVALKIIVSSRFTICTMLSMALSQDGSYESVHTDLIDVTEMSIHLTLSFLDSTEASERLYRLVRTDEICRFGQEWHTTHPELPS
jgi:hypothetical protein